MESGRFFLDDFKRFAKFYHEMKQMFCDHIENFYNFNLGLHGFNWIKVPPHYLTLLKRAIFGKIILS